MNLFRFISVFIHPLLFIGCAVHNIEDATDVAMNFCGERYDDNAAYAVTYIPSISTKPGLFDFYKSRHSYAGALLLHDDALALNRCRNGTVDNELAKIYYEDIELVYREEDWLFMRFTDKEGVREFASFQLSPDQYKSISDKSRDFESAIVNRIRNSKEQSLVDTPKVFIAHQRTIPTVYVSLIDRSSIGNNVAGRSLETAIGVALHPEALAYEIIFPPLIPIMLGIGATVGAVGGLVEGEIDARSNATRTTLSDGTIDSSIRTSGVQTVMPHQSTENLPTNTGNWIIFSGHGDDIGCSDTIHDCMHEGIISLFNADDVSIIFETNMSDYKDNPETAIYGLKLSFNVLQYNTINSELILNKTITYDLGSERMEVWKENQGEEIRIKLESIKPIVYQDIKAAIKKAINSRIPASHTYHVSIDKEASSASNTSRVAHSFNVDINFIESDGSGQSAPVPDGGKATKSTSPNACEMIEVQPSVWESRC
jgi:hypothetical protein